MIYFVVNYVGISLGGWWSQIVLVKITIRQFCGKSNVFSYILKIPPGLISIPTWFKVYYFSTDEITEGNFYLPLQRKPSL